MSCARQAAATMSPMSAAWMLCRASSGFFSSNQVPTPLPRLFQREDLRFVFHAAEGGGEDEAVAVALEVGAHRGFGAGGLADAVGGEQLRPVHVGCP